TKVAEDDDPDRDFFAICRREAVVQLRTARNGNGEQEEQRAATKTTLAEDTSAANSFQGTGWRGGHPARTGADEPGEEKRDTVSFRGVQEPTIKAEDTRSLIQLLNAVCKLKRVVLLEGSCAGGRTSCLGGRSLPGVLQGKEAVGALKPGVPIQPAGAPERRRDDEIASAVLKEIVRYAATEISARVESGAIVSPLDLSTCAQALAPHCRGAGGAGRPTGPTRNGQDFHSDNKVAATAFRNLVRSAGGLLASFDEKPLANIANAIAKAALPKETHGAFFEL
ncbi:unnamed protein product, partial [Amoebophrya sp. A120]